jgi:hypothetical protein
VEDKSKGRKEAVAAFNAGLAAEVVKSSMYAGYVPLSDLKDRGAEKGAFACAEDAKDLVIGIAGDMKLQSKKDQNMTRSLPNKPNTPPRGR